MVKVSKQGHIAGLDDFRLTRGALARMGRRPVRLSIQLKGAAAANLWHLRPKAREAALRARLTKQLNGLRRRFPAIDFFPRRKGHPSSTIDAVVPAHLVGRLSAARDVSHVTLNTVAGRKRRPPKSSDAWFCVWVIVAVQVEEQATGLVTIEDRLVLVKTRTEEEARRRVQRLMAKQARPYMNPAGYLVRWQIVSIRDVFELYDTTIDPNGTEVFSKLRQTRMRPEYRWPKSEIRKRAGSG